MPHIDYASYPVLSEWNAIWSARDVVNEAKNIDTQSELYRTVMDVLAEVPPDGTILEGGCGLGRWLLFGQTSHRMIGLDYSKVALNALKQHEPSTVLACGDVFQLPIRSATIDCYLSFGVLEHFKAGPLIGLHEAYRALKPGGTLLITGPGNVVGSLAEPLRAVSRAAWMRRLLRKPAIVGETHFFQYRFRPVEMRRYLRRAGFQIVNTVCWGNQETLWQHVPPLRHAATHRFRWYNDVVMSGIPDRLNGVGRGVHRAIRRAMPWLFHYAWAIRAVKSR